jgi:hypothetical protein
MKKKTSHRKQRYTYTLNNHGLKEYELEAISYVFESSSPNDAIRRVDEILFGNKSGGKRITYYAKQFLEAVAISAEADIINA